MTNTAPSEKAQRVCGIDELPIGEARRFSFGDVMVCVAHCNAGLRAISDWCSHAQYSLAEGEFDPETCEIECPQHGSLFSLVDGEPKTFPATEAVAVYDIEVRDGDVWVVLS